MCGIAGIIQKQPVADGLIDNMLGLMHHRGPDEDGRWQSRHKDWHIALGHKRLSIIDLQGGQQPMLSPSKNHCLTYNGEIFNFHDLKKTIPQGSWSFTSHSDSEVLLAHLARSGLEGLDQLNGMFAFGFWNQDTESLILARDRAGIKPLYYVPLPDGGIAFASELKPLMLIPGVSRQIDQQALASYFFNDYILPPHTILKNVYKLLPGHYLQWNKGGLSKQNSFWSFDKVPQRKGESTEGELIEELDGLLHKSIQRQLISDRPLGVFLSGGIDSSLVSALAQKKCEKPIKTFSIGFEESSFDESSFARQVAQFIGSEHVEKILSESLLFDVLDRVLDGLDEPMSDPSLLPTYLLSEVTAQHVTVALGGDGGDELFAGYPTYKAHEYAQYYGSLPRFIRHQAIPGFASQLPTSDKHQSFEWKLKRFSQRWDDDPIQRHFRWMSSTDRGDVDQIFNQQNDYLAFQRDWNFEAKDPINSFLRIDFHSFLSEQVLVKVDRASMAHSLEVRPPLLDNEIIDFAFSLSSDWKTKRGQGKYLLKKLAGQYLPEEIIYRRKKGFGIPLALWVKGPLQKRLERILQESPLWESSLLCQKTFQNWLMEHNENRVDRSKPLWSLIVLDSWVRQNLEMLDLR